MSVVALIIYATRCTGVDDILQEWNLLWALYLIAKSIYHLSVYT